MAMSLIHNITVTRASQQRREAKIVRAYLADWPVGQEMAFLVASPADFTT
jgi:hypothetical protein